MTFELQPQSHRFDILKDRDTKAVILTLTQMNNYTPNLLNLIHIDSYFFYLNFLMRPYSYLYYFFHMRCMIFCTDGKPSKFS